MGKASLIRAGWILAFLVGTILIATMAGWIMDFPLTQQMVKGLLVGAAVFLLVWLVAKGLTWFLWRVGRRLAFSYFLIGILPIPMVALLALLNLYLLAGYFLGHLYRDAVSELQYEIEDAAALQLARFETRGRAPSASPENLRFGFYVDGRRTAGADGFPLIWPDWVVEAEDEGSQSKREPVVSYVAGADGAPTLAAAAVSSRRGVIVLFDGSVERELIDHSDVWVTLLKAEDPGKEGLVRLDFMGRDFVLQPFATRPKSDARASFFGLAQEAKMPWWQQPVIWWGELSGPLRNLADGKEISEYLVASLNSTPTTVYRHLMPGSAEVDTAVWAGLVAISGVLLSIYVLAIVMAFFMIFGLSQAVNQLSRATDAVGAGYFSTRMPVRRKDQLGELQRSFNDMAAGLDRSVAAVAQKEILEKELEIARQLQQSLLPTDIPVSESIEFATLFEPSAAIGGDYFDILRLDEGRLVVVIADVSGHGLPTGLRMAMLKAALVILVEERKRPDEIFRRLSSMVRTERERHFFVTSTIAVVDFRKGELELTNAGHPPTYLVRRGEVIEIALPGNPLGVLGEDYGHLTHQLENGDVVVWLSDGIIEAANAAGEPFGYERLEEALAGPASSAAEVSNRLLAAEDAYTGNLPAEDDKTLVAMRYSAAAE